VLVVLTTWLPGADLAPVMPAAHEPALARSWPGGCARLLFVLVAAAAIGQEALKVDVLCFL
jgi:hypothetical protein